VRQEHPVLQEQHLVLQEPHLALREGQHSERRPARRGAKAESQRPPVEASLGWAHPSAVAGPAAQTLERRPFQVVQAAEVAQPAHLAQPADLEQQPVAARLAVQVAQVGPRSAEVAAAHGEAVPQPGAPDAEGVVAAVVAQHEAAAVAAVPDVGVAAEAEPHGEAAAVPADEGVEVVPPAERPSGAAPSAAAWAFRRDRFQPVARPARRPLAHSHSVRARAGLRVAQR
jgi:hypothetical protein